MAIKNLFRNKSNSKLTVMQVKEDQSYFTDMDVTPDQIVSAITILKNEKKLKDINDIYDKLLEQDDNLGSNIDTRTEALKSKKPVIMTELPDKHKQYFQDVLDERYPELVDIIIEAKLKRFAFRQVKYIQEGGLWYPEDFISYDNLDLRIEIVDQVKTLQLYMELDKTTLDEYRFIRLLRKRSILQSLLKYYAFKKFALNNWASFTEIFGKPIRVGKYEPGAGKAEKDELWNMLQQSGTDLAMMISKNVAMDFVDFAAKSASADLYKDLCEFSDKAVTKRILGQTLSTDAQKTGSFAQAKIHNLVRKDILAGDARDTVRFINDFLTRLNSINFSDQKIKTGIDVSDELNLLEKVQIDRVLINELGLVVDDEYLYKTYKVPKPGEI